MHSRGWIHSTTTTATKPTNPTPKITATTASSTASPGSHHRSGVYGMERVTVQEPLRKPTGELTPRDIVAELDKYIIGQDEAKKSVAIALRNRWRRQNASEDMRDEIMPNNIIMIGPTGVGKTEIARRLAKLAGAPFIKVEATKFTEVGYVGRDVDSMIRDLVETAIRMVKGEKMEAVQDRANELAEERLLEILRPGPGGRWGRGRGFHPLQALFGMGGPQQAPDPPEDEATIRAEREELRQRLRRGALEGQLVEVEVEDTTPRTLEVV